MKKPIDKVTTQRLNCVLRMVGISLSYEIIDRVIDVVELIEDKGGEVSIDDTTKLESEWKKSTK